MSERRLLLCWRCDFRPISYSLTCGICNKSKWELFVHSSDCTRCERTETACRECFENLYDIKYESSLRITTHKVEAVLNPRPIRTKRATK